MNRVFVLALIGMTLALPTAAQRSRCGTPEPVPMRNSDAVPSDCGYSTNTPQPEYEPTFFYDIPVVFHVIQNTSGEGFLSLETIQDQIDVLNEDFQAIPGSPGAPGTNGKIRFHLATTDPDGNATTGVTYSTNNNWFVDSGNYWDPLAWDTNHYMNVYTNAVPCCYGYVSGFPSEGIAGQTDDRIVLWWEAVGKDATMGWPLNMGRTGTHEAGHYLGLYHTFCGGCGSASNCYGTGDLICDTNREANPRYGCPGSASSCGSPDPIHNYMDYTDDPCLWEFTPEQVNRMRCTLEHWRPDLWTPTVYCDAKQNSAGCIPEIGYTGRPTLSGDDDFYVTADDVVGQTVGCFLWGLEPGPAGGAGTFGLLAPVTLGQCVLGATAVVLPTSGGTAGNCDGSFSVHFSQTQMAAAGIVPGTTVFAQFFYADPSHADGSGVGHTAAIRFCVRD